MRRRDFIRLIAGSTATWPLAAHAQQSKMPVIGFLGSVSPEAYAGPVRAFLQGLSETGYAEGRNVLIEYRWARGQIDRLPELANDLVGRQVAVIFTQGDTAARVAKAATKTIPIVFSGANDPVKLGLVVSLNRPGGNVTGATNLNVQLISKRLELVRELVPTAKIIAVLFNPTTDNAEAVSKELSQAASALGLQLQVLNANSERDLDAAFTTLAQLQPRALIITPDAFFNSRSGQLAALAVRHGVPAIFQRREFVAAGGLLSYGASLVDAYRQAGVYTGRILKGEKPANLPVVQATKVELVINLKTAQALGLTVPITLLGRANEVIE